MASHIGRRKFLATLLGGAAATWPLAARAQQQSKMLRVGFVGIEPRESPLYTNFLKRMAELGYQEGRNFTFDYIQTPDIEGYEKNYRELAARRVNVFLAVGNERALRAALLAAEGRPIAFLDVDFDPLARGMWRVSRAPGVMLLAFSYASSSSRPNASRLLARRSRARPSSESHLTRFRASNAMQQPRRLASWAWNRA